MKIEDIQGDWWWSFIEEATAGQRWRIDGDRIVHGDHELAWSEVPEGIRVEQPGDTFIVIEPSDDRFHTAHLYIFAHGEPSYWEGGTLVPYADAEKEGWTSRPIT